MPVIQTANVDATGVDILSNYVQQVLVESAVLIPSILDRSPEAQKGVKTIDIGRRSKLTAETKSEMVDYTSQSFTWDVDELAINLQEGVYVKMTKKADRSTVLNQEPEILQASAQALIDALEVRVRNSLKAVHASNIMAFGTPDKIALADILKARKTLRKANVPFDGNIFLAISPDQEADLLALEQFIDASRYGSTMALQNGELGQIYGVRILITTNIEASTAVMYHRTHSVFARSGEVSFEKSRILASSSSEYLLETFFGLKTLDLGKRGVLLNNSGT